MSERSRNENEVEINLKNFPLKFRCENCTVSVIIDKTHTHTQKMNAC